MTQPVFELSQYRIRRKLLKILGASFHVYDGDKIVGFSKQKAFKLKEDIRVYADAEGTQEVLLIQARQVVDFAAAYDIVDPADGTLVGTAQRKGFKSIMRDSWELHSADGGLIGQLQEDSMALAMIRRFVANIIPQKFTMDAGGGGVTFKQRFNPLIYSLEVQVSETCVIDKRLILGLAVLVAAIEGRQN